MGWRFYRRIKIFPGLTLNVSKKGVSLSVGERGAHVTLGHGRKRETISIPGTGISYTKVDKVSKQNIAKQIGFAVLALALIWLLLHLHLAR